MSSAYCLDSDVLISAHRRFYPFDVFPGFWNILEEEGRAGRVKIPLAVYDELVEGSENDKLEQWVRINKKILVAEPDPPIVEKFSEIVNFVSQNYEPQHVQKFLGDADPFVIATAWAKGMVVVTFETIKNETRDKITGKIKGKIKIPNICIHLGVPNITFTEMLRDFGVKFILG